ncbi:MAG TPA: hypothetical protein VF593_08665 [Chthoniobacteraceae bacterium]|jgi:drug/metabolite transporter (DMT)-like permease
MDLALRTRAILMLVVTAAAWGASFPLTKALQLALEQALPGRSSWLHSSLLTGGRFGAAALLLWLSDPRALARMKASEIRQGFGLGICAAFGMLFQADGLAFTEASTSAFLTQFVCVLVPLYVLLRDRCLPDFRVIGAVLMVVLGVAVLARIDWQTLRLGRGEVETLISATFFSAQLLWLERPIFRGNNSRHVTLAMFVTIAALLVPLAIFHAQRSSDLLVLVSSWSIATVFLALTLICSLFAFLVMNHWQPHVDASTASIAYCAEPVFATALALVIPAWLALTLGVNYANESMTVHLMVGGTLITLANLLIAWHPRCPEAVDLPDS